MTLQELGQAIREKREAAGLSIDDVAGRIKISARILRTIEEGSQNGLPHAVYTKSFIRVYGQLVGWDADDLAVHLEKLFPQESLDENSSEAVLQPLPLQYPGRGKRIAALLFLLVFLGAIGVGGWYVVTTYGSAIVEMVKKPFSALSDQEGEGDEAAPPSSSALPQDSLQALGIPSSGSQAPYASVPPAAGTPPPGIEYPIRLSDSAAGVPVSPASAGVGASEPLAGSIPVHEEPVGTAPAGQPESRTHQLRIIAHEECWVGHVADGTKGRDYLLRSGERIVLAYTDSIEVTLGRADNVRLELDGKELPAPDKKGRMVLRFP